MENLLTHIKEKAKEVLGTAIDSIEQFENVPNNSVYKIISAGRAYIFKIYKQKAWPEEGKLLFINKKLIENKINCAKILTFDRSDEYFQNGFLIEDYLPGKTADRISFSPDETKRYYIKLAKLVSSFHSIHIKNYGYIGSGIAGYKRLSKFFDYEFDERTKKLIAHNLWQKGLLSIIKEKFISNLKLCDYLPSVLCHGDLSTKNVMINDCGDYALIDWDDAMSYNWIADISRMTFWMKLNYGHKETDTYKDVFLDYYSTPADKKLFYSFEHVFHIYIGLDYMNYCMGSPQYDIVKKHFVEVIESL